MALLQFAHLFWTLGAEGLHRAERPGHAGMVRAERAQPPQGLCSPLSMFRRLQTSEACSPWATAQCLRLQHEHPMTSPRQGSCSSWVSSYPESLIQSCYRRWALGSPPWMTAACAAPCRWDRSRRDAKCSLFLCAVPTFPSPRPPTRKESEAGLRPLHRTSKHPLARRLCPFSRGTS